MYCEYMNVCSLLLSEVDGVHLSLLRVLQQQHGLGLLPDGSGLLLRHVLLLLPQSDCHRETHSQILQAGIRVQ